MIMMLLEILNGFLKVAGYQIDLAAWKTEQKMKFFKLRKAPKNTAAHDREEEQRLRDQLNQRGESDEQDSHIH